MHPPDHEPRPLPRAKPEPPEKPLPSDCCDGGCARCVHDIYAEELAHYERLLAEAGDQEPGAGGDKK